MGKRGPVFDAADRPAAGDRLGGGVPAERLGSQLFSGTGRRACGISQMCIRDRHHTEGLTCSSRTGRKLQRVKALAALPLSMAFYGLLALCTLAPYFLLYDYGGIWEASVSSQFNYLVDMLVVRPFLTWGDFTVGQYLAAALALGAVLTAVFSLLAFVCGTLVHNTYLAALALGVVCFGGMGLISALGELGWWAAYLIACFQPVMVWLSCSAWFTELGLTAVLPWQETIASGLNLLLLGAGSLLALRRFDREDVV